MLFLKRILAFFVDLILFTVTCIVIDWFFRIINLDLSNWSIFYIGFILSIVFPIILFSTPISYLILRIIPFEANRLLITLSHLLKYLFLFFLYSNFFMSIMSLFTNILNDYTYINVSVFYSLRVVIVIAICNIICFGFSLGRQNFFDFILEVKSHLFSFP